MLDTFGVFPNHFGVPSTMEVVLTELVDRE